MASAFNLTAQLNIVGPNNLRPIISNIRRQISGINTNLNITINTSAVNASSQLSQSLQNLSRNIASVTSSANTATDAINRLAGAMQAVNVNSSARNISAVTNASKQLAQQQTKTQQALQQSTDSMQEFGKQSALAIRRFAAFTLVTGLIYKFTNALSMASKEFMVFNKEMVRLTQVTGLSMGQLSSLEKTITSLSTSLGVTSTELIGVSSTLAQAGLTINQTEQALKALALSALAPSFDDMNETVEGSIALMRQFSIESSQLESVLGSVNAVAAKFAVEANDIIVAIQRTGGVFAAASKGVSEGSDALNEFIALFTSVRQTTRESAETIATGLRTIFTRIQRKDTVDLLKQYGIELTDLEGKFVGPYEAVRRLNAGLAGLDTRDIRYSRIIEELGGFRQVGKVIPLLQQFTVAQQALGVAQRGSTSLSEDAAKAQQSLAIQMAKVQEEFVAMVRKIGSSNEFQTMVKLSLDFASALIKLADSAKYALPAISAMLAIKGTMGAIRFTSGFIGGIRRGGGAAGLGDRMSGAPRAFRNGGEVPVALMPGETVIFPDQASQIGKSTLNRLNHADRNGLAGKKSGGSIGRFARGGYAQVPGRGRTDSFYTSLPEGSFVIRTDATSALGGPQGVMQAAKGYRNGGEIQKLSRGKYVKATLGQLSNQEPGRTIIPGSSHIKRAMDKYPEIMQKPDSVGSPIKVKEIDFKKEDFPTLLDLIHKEKSITRGLLEQHSGNSKNIDKIRKARGIGLYHRIKQQRIHNADNASKGLAFEQFILQKEPKLERSLNRNLNDTLYNPLDFKKGDSKFVSDSGINDYKSRSGQLKILSKRLRAQNNGINLKWTEKIGEHRFLPPTTIYIPPRGAKREFDIWYANEINNNKKYRSLNEEIRLKRKPKMIGGEVQKFKDAGSVRKRSTKGIKRGSYGRRGFKLLEDKKEYALFAERAYREAGEYGGPNWDMRHKPPMPKVLASYVREAKKYIFESGGAGIEITGAMPFSPKVDQKTISMLEGMGDVVYGTGIGSLGKGVPGFIGTTVMPFGKGSAKSKQNKSRSMASDLIKTKNKQNELLAAAITGVQKSFDIKGALTRKQLDELEDLKDPAFVKDLLQNNPIGIRPRGPRKSIEQLESLYASSEEFQKQVPGAYALSQSGSSSSFDFKTISQKLKSFKEGKDTFQGALTGDQAGKVKSAIKQLLSQSQNSSGDSAKAKAALEHFDSFVGGASPQKPGHLSAFTWAVNQVFKRGIVRLQKGGLVQKLMSGSSELLTQPDILQKIARDVTRLGGIGGIKDLLGLSKGDREADKALRVQGGTILAKHASLASQLVLKAKKAKVQRVKQQIVENRQKRGDVVKSAQQGLLFAAAGLRGVKYSPIQKTVGEGILKNPVDVHITSGLLNPETTKKVEKILDRNNRRANKQAAKTMMISNILDEARSGKIINLDFDRTLAFGADKILSDPTQPKFSEFSDETKVKGALSKAKLSKLGKGLRNLVRKNPEIAKNLRVVTARPQATMPYIQSWLASKGLPITDLEGVGGPNVSTKQVPLLKAAKLKPGLFIDDDSANIDEASKISGITTYLYKLKKPKKDPNRAGARKGYSWEEILESLGAPKANKTLKSIDFPTGLQAAAKFFGVPANIPTDAKRTLSGPAQVEKNIVNYLKAKGYKSGGSIPKLKSKKERDASRRGLPEPFTWEKENVGPGPFAPAPRPPSVNFEEMALAEGLSPRMANMLAGYARANGIKSDVHGIEHFRDLIRERKRSLNLTTRSVGGEIPIMAQEGEFIINKHAAGQIGYSNLKKLNRGGKLATQTLERLPKYHTGGVVQHFKIGGKIKKMKKADRTLTKEERKARRDAYQADPAPSPFIDDVSHARINARAAATTNTPVGVSESRVSPSSMGLFPAGVPSPEENTGLLKTGRSAKPVQSDPGSGQTRRQKFETDPLRVDKADKSQIKAFYDRLYQEEVRALKGVYDTKLKAAKAATAKVDADAKQLHKQEQDLLKKEYSKKLKQAKTPQEKQAVKDEYNQKAQDLKTTHTQQRDANVAAALKNEQNIVDDYKGKKADIKHSVESAAKGQLEKTRQQRSAPSPETVAMVEADRNRTLRDKARKERAIYNSVSGFAKGSMSGLVGGASLGGLIAGPFGAGIGGAIGSFGGALVGSIDEKSNRIRAAGYQKTASNLKQRASIMAEGGSSGSAIVASLNKAFSPLVSVASKVSSGMAKLHTGAAVLASGLSKVSSGTGSFFKSLGTAAGRTQLLEKAIGSAIGGIARLAKGADSAVGSLMGMKRVDIGGGKQAWRSTGNGIMGRVGSLFGMGGGAMGDDGVTRDAGGRRTRGFGGKGKGGGGGGMGGMGIYMMEMGVSMAGSAILDKMVKDSGGESTKQGRELATVGGSALTGATTGMMIGSTIGSVIPGLGTLVGGGIGAAIGGATGAAYGISQMGAVERQADSQKRMETIDKARTQMSKDMSLSSDVNTPVAVREKARQRMLGSISTISSSAIADSTAGAKQKTGFFGGVTSATSMKERISNAQGAADSAKEFLSAEMQRTGKTLEELEQSMDPAKFRELMTTIALTDEGFQSNLEAANGNLSKIGEGTVKAAAMRVSADLKASEEIMKAAQQNAKLQQAIQKLIVSFERSADNMLNATAAAQTILTNSAANISAISNPTQSAMIGASYGSKNKDILSNPSAYSVEEVEAAASSYSGLYGKDSEQMVRAATLPRRMEDSFGRAMVGARSSSGSGDKTDTETRDSVRNALMQTAEESFGPEISEGMREQINAFVANFEGDIRQLNFNDVLKQIQGFASGLASSEKVLASFKAQAELASMAMQMQAEAAQAVASKNQEIRDIQAQTYNDIASSTIAFKKAIGERVSWTSGAGARNQAKAIRMGTDAATAADPTKILAKWRAAGATREAAMSAQQSNPLQFEQGQTPQGDQLAADNTQKLATATAEAAQAQAQFRQELMSLPDDIKQNISGIMEELQEVLQDRAAKINSASGFMEKVLTSTPKGLRELGNTFNNMNRALSGRAVSFQESYSANTAYRQVRNQGGSHMAAQRAAQDAYAKETGDTLNLAKELAPLLGAVDPTAQAQMMGSMYESMFAARGIDTSQMMVGGKSMKEYIEMMKQGPKADPKVAALEQALDGQQKALQEATNTITMLLKDESSKIIKDTGDAIIKAINETRIRFDEAQLKDAGLGISRPGDATPAGSISATEASAKASSAASSSQEELKTFASSNSEAMNDAIKARQNPEYFSTLTPDRQKAINKFEELSDQADIDAAAKSSIDQQSRKYSAQSFTAGGFDIRGMEMDNEGNVILKPGQLARKLGEDNETFNARQNAANQRVNELTGNKPIFRPQETPSARSQIEGPKTRTETPQETLDRTGNPYAMPIQVPNPEYKPHSSYGTTPKPAVSSDMPERRRSPSAVPDMTNLAAPAAPTAPTIGASYSPPTPVQPPRSASMGLSNIHREAHLRGMDVNAVRSERREQYLSRFRPEVRERMENSDRVRSSQPVVAQRAPFSTPPASPGSPVPAPRAPITQTNQQNQDPGVLKTAAAFDMFASKLDTLLTKLAEVSIPEKIVLEGTNRVLVQLEDKNTINKIAEQIQKGILAQAGQQLANYDKGTSGEGASQNPSIMRS